MVKFFQLVCWGDYQCSFVIEKNKYYMPQKATLRNCSWLLFVCYTKYMTDIRYKINDSDIWNIREI